MDQKEFYSFSAKLSLIRARLESLTNLHAYRYKYFVDSSPHKTDCKYAIATKQAYEREHEIEKLTSILDELENEIKTVRTMI